MSLTLIEWLQVATVGLLLLIFAALVLDLMRKHSDDEGFSWPKWSTEPALIVGVVQAAITVALAFGLDLTDEQSAALLALAVALFGGSVVTRQQVTPVARQGETTKRAAK